MFFQTRKKISPTSKRKCFLPAKENISYQQKKIFPTSKRKYFLPAKENISYQQKKVFLTNKRKYFLPASTQSTSEPHFDEPPFWPLVESLVEPLVESLVEPLPGLLPSGLLRRPSVEGTWKKIDFSQVSVFSRNKFNFASWRQTAWFGFQSWIKSSIGIEIFEV